MTEAVEVGIVFPLLIVLIYPFSRRRLRRLDSRLAAASLQQEDWSLGFAKVPSELVQEIRRDLSAGAETHITDTERRGDELVRVVDITPSGLAFVLRPRRRRKR
ncbi:hypothetical protein [Streptomyces sp. NPDC058268]|uniref:hypothetical protein n=1 Tax=Streptomyces sp. NPDC058268 TaxID=3346413 RepID=UPI0036EC0620